MQRKRINLPNYYKLFHVHYFAKLFGIDDDTYNVIRWELKNGENAKPIDDLKYGHGIKLVFDF